MPPSQHRFVTPEGVPLEEAAFASLSEAFIPNAGQLKDAGVAFHSGNFQFTPSGPVIRMQGEGNGFSVFKVNFKGARNVIPEGLDPLAGRCHFILGDDPDGWNTDVPRYGRLIYRDLYEGIDLVYRTVPGGIKYEFLLEPGADVSDIRFEYEGARPRTDGQNIFMDTFSGTLADEGLMAYQPTDGARPCPARVVEKGGAIGFEADHDPELALVIDPLVHSTFIGGSGFDGASSVAADGSGNIYVTGWTMSADFPTTPGAYSTSYGTGIDAFVVKYNVSIGAPVYSTFFGGSGLDRGQTIAVDPSGSAYVAGVTNQSVPTTAGAIDNSPNGGTDAFVFKLNPFGNLLAYSTLLGGSGDDNASALVLDSFQNAVVAGTTASTGFPTTSGAYDIFSNYVDAFVTKLSHNGTGLLFSTYLGGSGTDSATAMDIDDRGNIYVTGDTTSTDYPTSQGCYDPVHNGGGADAFLTRLNSSGGSLDYSTLIGGGGEDRGCALRLVPSGGVAVAGVTNSSDFPVGQEAFDSTYNGGGDVFLLELNSSGASLLHSTYLGGSAGEVVGSLALDAAGNFALCGATESTDLPATDDAADRSQNGGLDAFLALVDANLSALFHSTFLGGMGNDSAISLYVDAYSNAFLAGETASADFPTTAGAYDRTMSGGKDAFIAKYSLPSPPATVKDLAAQGLDRRVSLSWTNPPGHNITGHIVLRGGNASSLSYLAETGNVTSFNDTAVTNGVPYRYSIQARNAIGTGVKSAIVNVTPGRVPDAPGDFRAAPGDSMITLAWLAPVDDGGFPVLGYRVYRGERPNALGLYIALGNATGFTDKGVRNGLGYYYDVASYNLRGENHTATLAVEPGAAPSAPRSVCAYSLAKTIRISWESPSENGGFSPSNYTVYRGISPEALEAAASVAGTSYEDKNVSLGKRYYYRVSATNKAGEGERSAMVDCELSPTRPGVPLNLTAKAGDGQVALTWLAPADDGGSPVTGYRVLRGKAGSPLTYLDEVPSPAYLDINVTNGVSYNYSVAALNLEGAGDPSAAVNAIPRGEGRRPDPPTNLGALPWDSLVVLSWFSPKNNGGLELSEYRIYRGTGGEDPIFLANATDTIFIDYAVQNDMPYNYSITAVNLKGESNRTGRVPATPFLPGSVPSAPRDLKAGNTPTGISLGWNVPDSNGSLAITGYQIYRGAPGDWQLLATTSSLAYLDSTGIIGKSYAYRVTAVNRKGESEPSQEVVAVHTERPEAVANLTVVKAGGRYTLSWSAPGGDGGLSIIKYNIYGGTPEKKMQFLCSTKAANFTESRMVTTLYYYKVVAVNGNGEGTPAWFAVQPEKLRTVPSGTFDPVWWALVALISCGIAAAAAAFHLRGPRTAKKDAPK